jgi:hypothetical protein
VAGEVNFDEQHLVFLSPWGRAASIAAVTTALVIIALAWRALRHEPLRGRRWILLSLRAGAVLSALVMFFQPAIRQENVTRLPNHLAVLVDQSESMRLSEQPTQPSRGTRARSWIEKEAPRLDELRKTHLVDFYSFGERLAPTTLDALSPTPRAEATRLREALAQLRARYDGRDLAGVIVVSDGIDNGKLSGEALGPDSIDFLKSLDAPVHAAWVGRPGLHDVAIAGVGADDFAFVRTALQIEATLRVNGAAEAHWEGKRLPVTLRRDGVPIKTVDVEIEPDITDYRVTFAFTPERVGKYVYEISTPVLDGEAIAENNARAFLLKVVRDKIRVLQVAGRPSWDERFLRGLLKRDPNVDLISFFILRTPNDLETVSSDELSLIPFPTEELFEEQLRSFDVVFLQNFNYAPYGIGAYLGEIRRYVEEGGGMAMIGGDLSFSLGGYAHTPVSDILPVDIPEGEEPPGGVPSMGKPLPASALADLSPFRLQLTSEGRNHPITALKLDLKLNEARWMKLPELEGTNIVTRARPGATVLGTHPTRRDADGKPLPVLTVGEANKGRVLALTSDSSWRWSFAGDSQLYQRFWENAIRWLIRDPALSFLHIETDQSEYGRGQKVGIVVSAVGTDYQPLADAELSINVASLASASGKPEPIFGKSGRTDEAGELHLELEPPRSGGYRITARATISGRPVVEEEVFLVRGAGRELEEPEARDDILRAVAAATGGSFLGPGASWAGLRLHPPRVVRVNKHRDLELWSGWWVLLIAAVCLSANWALRRRWGYA